jgi:hypothetical protein
MVLRQSITLAYLHSLETASIAAAWPYLYMAAKHTSPTPAACRFSRFPTLAVQHPDADTEILKTACDIWMQFQFDWSQMS